jgi:hypothetical protein
LYFLSKTVFCFLLLSSADNEITYRQELEMKYKELTETTHFERRLLEQEIENAKYQMKFANETIEKLGKFMQQRFKAKENSFIADIP